MIIQILVFRTLHLPAKQLGAVAGDTSIPKFLFVTFIHAIERVLVIGLPGPPATLHQQQDQPTAILPQFVRPYGQNRKAGEP